MRLLTIIFLALTILGGAGGAVGAVGARGARSVKGAEGANGAEGVFGAFGVNWGAAFIPGTSPDTLYFEPISSHSELNSLVVLPGRYTAGILQDGRTIQLKGLSSDAQMLSLRHFGDGGGTFQRLVDLSLVQGGRILATDAAKGRVFLFDEWLRLLASWPRNGATNGESRGVSHLNFTSATYLADGQMIALDSATGTLFQFRSDGTLSDEARLELPYGFNADLVAMNEQSIHIADSQMGTVLSFELDGVYVRSHQFNPGLLAIESDSEGVFALTPEGLHFSSYRGTMSRFWSIPANLNPVSFTVAGSKFYMSTSDGVYAAAFTADAVQR